MIQLSNIEKRIINDLQGGFPLTERPYKDVADSLGISESELIEILGRLLDERVITRFGPLYDVEKIGGKFCLCAMQVPEDIFADVTRRLNSMKEVAHNYRRNNRLNMWFVLAVEHERELDEIIQHIESITRLQVLPFPKEREFFIGLNLEV